MTKLLTPQAISNEALKILESEMDIRGANRVFSLVEVTIKDGTVLGPIMIGMEPHELHNISEIMRAGHSVFTLANDNESILVPAADVKYIKALRVTSKE